MNRPRTIGLSLAAVGFVAGLTAARAPELVEPAARQEFVRIGNRYRGNQFLHVERGALESGPVEAGWWSADWVVERVADAPAFVRLRNRYRGTMYLHNQNGRAEAGPIEPGWWSAQWTLAPVAGSEFVQIQNRWKPTEYLHVETGALACGPIQPGWWSAQWRVAGTGAAIASRAPGGRGAEVQRTLPTQGAPPNRSADIASRVLFGDAQPDICWRDSYGRGVGEPLSTCGAGQEKDGLLCYPACRDGFGGAGPVCWRRCPAGWTDIGVSCTKPAPYGRGTGFAYNPFVGEGRDAARRRCEASHGAGNCERSLEMFYPRCRAGFSNVGSNICSPVCPAGFRNDGAFCAKESYGRTAGEPMRCRAGTEQGGALCYQSCRAGSTGVGPVCWANACPAAFPVNCGAACGVSSAVCAMAIMEQVQSTADLALNVASLVTTGGAATPALRAAQTAGRGARQQLTAQARAQLRRQAREQLENGLAWQRRDRQVSQAQGWLENGQNLETASLLMVDAYEKGEFDFTQLTPSVADVEPTGVLAVVRSFNKPICR